MNHTATMQGLSGNFRLTGEGSQKANPYDQLENMVRAVLSNDGKYSLNRMSGSLYVKDRSSVIVAVSRLINHFKDMMARQIIIEARIIEVGLTDGHRYGIDWSYVKDKLSSTAQDVRELSWSIGEAASPSIGTSTGPGRRERPASKNKGTSNWSFSPRK